MSGDNVYQSSVVSRNYRKDNCTLNDEPSNIYANEIVRSLFGGGTGSVKGDFPCSNGRNRGRLYVASNAVCFYSYFFGYEQKILVLYEFVQSIEKPKKHTIVVLTNENEEHIFRNFQDRDLVWDMLDDLYQKSTPRTTKLSSSAATSASLGNNHKHNSATLRETPILKRSISQETTQVSNLSSSAVRPRTYSHSREVMITNSNSNDSPNTSNNNHNNNTNNNYQRDNVHDSEKHHNQNSAPMEQASANNSPHDINSQWSKLKRTYLLQDCLEQTVHSHHFDCSLDEYFNTFLADEAFYPMEIYQKEKHGDSNFITSKWKEMEQEEDPSSNKFSATMERQITYVHPNKATMGPSMIYVTQLQKFRRYGDHGIWFWKRTQISGVPAADCFHVEEEILFEPDGDGIEMKLQFNIIFKKRTILRSIIESTTRNESIEGLEESVQYMRDALKGEVEQDGKKNEEWIGKFNDLERLQFEFQTKMFMYIRIFVAIIVCLILVLYLFHKKIHNMNETFFKKEDEWRSTIQSLEIKINEMQLQLQTNQPHED